MKIKIAIIDDHQMFREGIHSLLDGEESLDVVGEASNGLDGLRLVENTQPDVVLMDVGMAAMNGIEATRRILSKNPKIKVIALSMYDDSHYIEGMLQAGAKGYLLKNCAFDELSDAIQHAMKGKVYISPHIACTFVSSYFDAYNTSPSVKQPALSTQERAVLQLIAEGKTSKEIANLLHISIKTVDTHRQHIMSKLDLHNIADLTRFAIKQGMVIP